MGETNVAAATENSGSSSMLGDAAAPADAQQATPAEGDTPPADDTEASGDDQPASDAEDKPVGAPEEYEFTAPENSSISEDVLEVYKEAAREADLSQEAAQAIVDKIAPAIAKQQEAQVQAIRQEWIDTSKNDKEFGGDELQANLGVAKEALEKFGTPELTQLLNETGLGNHPELIRCLYRVGKTLKQDNFVDGKAKSGKTTGPKGFNDHAEALYPQSNG